MENRAFTLLELLVVITIIGVLASIVVVSMSGSTDSATIAKGKAYAQQVHALLGSNAVGIWNFDEGTGDTVYDISGYGNDGTLAGDTHFVPSDIEGYALSFDGTGDYVDITTNLSSYITDEITIEMWIYPYLVPTSGHDYILNWYHTVSLTTSYQVCVGCGVFFCRIDGISYPVYGKNIIPENEWMHIIGTREENIIRLYKNGILEGEGTNVSTGKIDNATTLYIAQYPSAGYQFNGLIDEVRIYSEALSATEIQKHYVQGLNNLLFNQAITKAEHDQRMEEFKKHLSAKSI